MKIEVGEYVRYKDGTISKVLDINKDETFDLLCENFTLSSKFVVKHSKNIIDLIEVGDYVNGRRVLEIERTKNNEIEICILKGNIFSDWTTINDKNIKSIVTKEQFESIEYKVKENN